MSIQNTFNSNTFCFEFRRPEVSFVVAFRNSVHDVNYKNAHKQYVCKNKQALSVYFSFSALPSYPTHKLDYSLLRRVYMHCMDLWEFCQCMSKNKYVCINWLYSLSLCFRLVIVLFSLCCSRSRSLFLSLSLSYFFSSVFNVSIRDSRMLKRFCE